MELLGYFAAVLIGVSLALIGGGGSILTVPVLVYLFGMDAVQAISYSLFVVGCTSLVGAYTNYRKNQLSISTALLFGLSSITTVFLVRKFVIPAIPEVIATVNGFEIRFSLVTMVVFAVLMLLASLSMIKTKKALPPAPASVSSLHRNLKLLSYGLGIGLVTGFLGAGGGFLMVPALVLLVGLPMKTAVGTSLFIIALNSLIGFTGDLGNYSIDWVFLLKITAIAVGGILVGSLLATRISGANLKKGFGWFVLIMAIVILAVETVNAVG